MAGSLLPAVPSVQRVRAELEQKVIADLLGPAARPDKEVVERTVRDRCLVGVLAPRRRKDEPPVECVAGAKSVARRSEP
jgi:hypothetical protein